MSKGRPKKKPDYLARLSGYRLKKVRESFDNITQEAFAIQCRKNKALSSLTSTTISYWETGRISLRSSIYLEELCKTKLLKSHNITADYLRCKDWEEILQEIYPDMKKIILSNFNPDEWLLRNKFINDYYKSNVVQDLLRSKNITDENEIEIVTIDVLNDYFNYLDVLSQMIHEDKLSDLLDCIEQISNLRIKCRALSNMEFMDMTNIPEDDGLFYPYLQLGITALIQVYLGDIKIKDLDQMLKEFLNAKSMTQKE